MPAAIEVEKIVKRFGDFTAVNGVSFTVEPGEIFGLLGPNGAGKPTLIRMLTTLLPPTSGTARVGGFDIVARANDVRRAIGVIPQAMTSDLELTVRENLLIHAKLYGVPRDRRKRIIGELLEAVELTAWADKPVKNLSGGMRRRAEIARGLVHEPRIFFLDEPTTGLDPVSRVAVWEMLQQIKSHRDLTVLLTTHYMDEADRLCNRIAIVDHGELVALDAPMTLKASIPGKNVLEVSFGPTPADWEQRLRALPGVENVLARDHVVRLASTNGPATTLALMEAAERAGVAVQSLSVQSTSLDDVFVHYTGRDLRDAVHDAAPRESPFVLPRGRWRASRVGPRRARAPSVSAQPDPDGHVAPVPGGAARRARLRVRRQREASARRRGRSGPRALGRQGARAHAGGRRRRQDLRRDRVRGLRPRAA
jgi:ABC-2 type transport system ATP-binding protein